MNYLYRQLFIIIKNPLHLIQYQILIMYSQLLNGKYYGDSPCLFGKYPYFSDYIRLYGQNVHGHGVDIGAGPQGCNSKFFISSTQLDGCDIQKDVVSSLPSDKYTKTFIYSLGEQILPYEDNSLDFVICSCVIHHLNCHEQVQKGIKQMCRVLKSGGSFFLIYKSGINDTQLTHYHQYFKQYRTVRVFSNTQIDKILLSQGMYIKSEYILGDVNWVPYVCTISYKK